MLDINKRAEIMALREEASVAGDLVQVAVCDQALDGVAWAIAECQRVIQATQAQED